MKAFFCSTVVQSDCCVFFVFGALPLFLSSFKYSSSAIAGCFRKELRHHLGSREIPWQLWVPKQSRREQRWLVVEESVGKLWPVRKCTGVAMIQLFAIWSVDHDCQILVSSTSCSYFWIWTIRYARVASNRLPEKIFTYSNWKEWIFKWLRWWLIAVIAATKEWRLLFKGRIEIDAVVSRREYA